MSVTNVNGVAGQIVPVIKAASSKPEPTLPEDKPPVSPLLLTGELVGKGGVKYTLQKTIFSNGEISYQISKGDVPVAAFKESEILVDKKPGDKSPQELDAQKLKAKVVGEKVKEEEFDTIKLLFNTPELFRQIKRSSEKVFPVAGQPVTADLWDYVRLANGYKYLAQIQPEETEAKKYYAKALEVLNLLVGIKQPGDKPDIKKVEEKNKSFDISLDDLAEGKKTVQVDVIHAYYLALASLGEIYLALGQYDQVSKQLPVANDELAKEIRKLFAAEVQYEAANLVGRIYQARAEAFKNQEKYDAAKNELNAARALISESIKTKPGEAGQKILLLQLKSIEVSMAEIELEKKDADAALSGVQVFVGGINSMINFANITNAVANIYGRRNRESLIKRAAFVLSDAKKFKALKSHDQTEVLELNKQTADLLEGLSSLVVSGSKEYFRLKVSLAEAQLGLGENQKAQDLLKEVSGSKENFLPLEAFNSLPEKEKIDYFVRANLVMISALFNANQTGVANNVLITFEAKIPWERMGEEEKKYVKNRLADFTLFK